MGCREHCDSFRDGMEWYVRIMCALLMTLAIVILGVGGYMLNTVGESLGAINLESPGVASVVFGVFLFIFAVIGVWAVYSERRVLKLIFVVGVLFLTTGVMASGAALLVYSSLFDDIRTENIRYKLEETILAFQLKVFEKCCMAGPTFVAENQCPDDAPGRFPCFNEDEFNRMDNLVGDTVCLFLGSIEQEEGVPFVSTTNEESCGQQNPANFVDEFSALIDSNITALGTANIILCVLMLLLSAASCYLLWTEDEDDRRSDDETEDDTDDEDQEEEEKEDDDDEEEEDTD